MLRHNGFCAVAMVDIDVNDRHLENESMGYAATPSEHWRVFFLMGNPKQKWMMTGGYLQFRKAPWITIIPLRIAIFKDPLNLGIPHFQRHPLKRSSKNCQFDKKDEIPAEKWCMPPKMSILIGKHIQINHGILGYTVYPIFGQQSGQESLPCGWSAGRHTSLGVD